YPDDLLLVRFRGEADMHRGSASTGSVADDSSWKSTYTANGEQVVNRRRRAPPRSDTEKLLERSCGPGDRLRIGALLCIVLWGGEAVTGAAVDLQLEGNLPGAQLLDHTVDCGEWIAFVFGAVQDQVHAFGVLRPSCLVVAERAVDRDICNERCAGCPELNANRAAKAVADERDLGRVDDRVLDEGIEPRLGPRTHQRAVLGVDCGLRLHFRDVLRQHALAVTEYIGCE